MRLGRLVGASFLLMALIVLSFFIFYNRKALKSDTFFVAFTVIPSALTKDIVEYDRFLALSYSIRRPLFKWSKWGIEAEALSDFSLSGDNKILKLCPNERGLWCGSGPLSVEKLKAGIENLVKDGALVSKVSKIISSASIPIFASKKSCPPNGLKANQ